MSSGFGKRLKFTLGLWMACLIEGLLFLPLWILLEVYLHPVQAPFPWYLILPVLSLSGVLLRHRVNRRWMQILASLPIGAAAGFILGGAGFNALPIMLVCALFAYLGMNAADRGLGIKTYSIGLIVYFAAVIIYARVPELQHSLTLLTWCGCGCLILALLNSNLSFMRYNSFAAGAERLPFGMKRYNRLSLVLFVAAAALLASGAVKAVATLILGALYLLFGLLSRLFSNSEDVPISRQDMPASQEFLRTEMNEPGLLSAILDVIFYGLAAAVALAVLYFGVRWLYRNSSGIFRRVVDSILSILRRENAREQNGFKDEEESIFAWEQTMESLRKFIKNRLKPGGRSDRWEAMDGSNERVRWLYRHWLNARAAEGYRIKSHLTPRETGADVAEWSGGRKQARKGEHSGSEAQAAELLQLYNEARYGQSPASASGKEPGQLDQLKKQLKL